MCCVPFDHGRNVHQVTNLFGVEVLFAKARVFVFSADQATQYASLSATQQVITRPSLDQCTFDVIAVPACVCLCDIKNDPQEVFYRAVVASCIASRSDAESHH